ncbi:hypothetical protein [Vitiosangium sp. GDMCC 1.1324]|uniref:hypothetical protein n=1 Tax=Vitiosangium sp. (strain GDMCC 1.1324) TaxID=2138576 RepID=UPI000D38805F|nr:hypothetical protein [Vitiosangium sp. GDMCC 1.1324]PTL85599.1 hypothetical protein DAT35_02475 [Vitiosangium sp. GDMCC 1.1324]
MSQNPSTQPLHVHDEERGLQETLRYPLFDALRNRRTRRVAKGIKSIPAGSLSYTSKHEPEPLTALEEALLIASTGITGVTLPDQPFLTEDGKPLVGSPMVDVVGRTAGSPDNAQATHFFLINDSGTYFLSRPQGEDAFMLAKGELTAARLIAYADKCKVKVSDQRVDFPRQYPYYMGRNRYMSNVPGSTILVPVVDLTRQYINGIMFLLTQDAGHRPTFIDDWNFYRVAGVQKWVRNGFLNKDQKIPLGVLGNARIPYEADFLMQNIFLVAEAMGLGAWIHAAFIGPVLLGDPDYRQAGNSLGFRYHTPRNLLRQALKFISPLPSWRPNPVGLDGLLQGYCPPYYGSMNEAIDALISHKYGPTGLYTDPKEFDKVFKPGLAKQFVSEVPHYSEEVIACAKDVCNYIYETYDRFPAHADAMHVPGVWIQMHHLDLDYYDQLFANGYSETQARHEELWHGRR